ncbi:hypothetical protein XFLAVUS301_53370 [Xanthobacter flavus]|uniref:Uncharacterized protein n=1 Tax=Xanthobacter flavus TaxID=281 RepID=A0A9W6CNJ7_XANFL|nr:hypothetical protein XFLAVUS301_53370 [Xanthobacter flavus]
MAWPAGGVPSRPSHARLGAPPTQRASGRLPPPQAPGMARLGPTAVQQANGRPDWRPWSAPAPYGAMWGARSPRP